MAPSKANLYREAQRWKTTTRYARLVAKSGTRYNTFHFGSLLWPSRSNRLHADLGMMNRILSGVRRTKNSYADVQPAWSTPDRIGWTEPLPRGARPIGNWNPRLR